jgi:hypothetical protein
MRVKALTNRGTSLIDNHLVFANLLVLNSLWGKSTSQKFGNIQHKERTTGFIKDKLAKRLIKIRIVVTLTCIQKWSIQWQIYLCCYKTTTVLSKCQQNKRRNFSSIYKITFD